MDTISKLIEQFRQFPGIGPRQAKRFVYFLLGQSEAYRAQLATLVLDLKKQIRVCVSCQRFFPIGVKLSDTCVICADVRRSEETLLVVCRDVDFENIEKSHTYDGKYFILGGSVPILEKNPEQRVRSRELAALVEKMADKPKYDPLDPDNDPAVPETSKSLKEVILAFNLTPEGEHTQHYIQGILAPLVAKYHLTVSVLGRGLSTGLELEYSDSETVKNALRGRQRSE
ncbi:MAG: toprim domain-containing protein [bacterium]